MAVFCVPGVIALRDEQNRTILNVGYLTAITGELMDKQGLAISGALTMALDEVSRQIKNFISVDFQFCKIFYFIFFRSTTTPICCQMLDCNCAGMTQKVTQ